jgi:hypothetical protein
VRLGAQVCLKVANKYAKTTRRTLDGRATVELSHSVAELLDYLLVRAPTLPSFDIVSATAHGATCPHNTPMTKQKEAASPESTTRACALAIILSRISAQWVPCHTRLLPCVGWAIRHLTVSKLVGVQPQV